MQTAKKSKKPKIPDYSQSWIDKCKYTVVMHVRILHCETRHLHRHVTLFFLILLCLIQYFTINGTAVLGLDFMASSKVMVSLFFLACFLTPLIILGLGIYFCYQQVRLTEFHYQEINSKTFSDSYLFKFYLVIYRFSIFVTEPISTGFYLSLIPTSHVVYHFRDDLGLAGMLALALPSFFALIQSTIYLFFVESVLPSYHVLSSASIMNLLMLNLTVKLGLCVDAFTAVVARSGENKFSVLGFVLLRNVASLYAIYWNLFRCVFFFNNGRLTATSIHAGFVIFAVLNYTAFTLNSPILNNYLMVPVLMLGTVTLKLVYNLERFTKINEADPQNCNFVTALNVSQSCFTLIKNSEEEESLSSISILQAREIEAYINSRETDFEQFRLKYTAGLQQSDSVLIDFCLFLFHKLILRTKMTDLKMLLFQGYYLNQLNMNLYQVTINLENMSRFLTSWLLDTDIYCLKEMVRENLARTYLNQVQLNSSEFRSYRTKLEESVHDRDQVRQIKYTMNGGYNLFDSYKNFAAVALHEEMVHLMLKVVDYLLELYQQLSKKNIQNSTLHRTTKKIFAGANKVSQHFRLIEAPFVHEHIKPTFHLLPYAMFLDTVANNRLEMSAIIKMYKDRSHIIYREQQRVSYTDIFTVLDLESMATMGVQCHSADPGLITYCSKNTQAVLDTADPHLQGQNISVFFSEYFKPIHAALVKELVQRHKKHYLGSQRKRFLRVRDHYFEEVNTLIKIAPLLSDGLPLFVTCMAKTGTSGCYLVTAPDGTIEGFNSMLEHVFPTVCTFLSQNVHDFSQDLKMILDKEVTLALNPKGTGSKLSSTSSGHQSFQYFASLLEFANLQTLNENEDTPFIERQAALQPPLHASIDTQQMVLNFNVDIRPFKKLKAGKDVHLPDILLRISSDNINPFNKERDSTTPISKLAINNSPHRTIDNYFGMSFKPKAKAKKREYSRLRGGYQTSADHGHTAANHADGPRPGSNRVLAARSLRADTQENELLKAEDIPQTEQSRSLTNTSLNSMNYKHRLYSLIKKQKKQYVWKEFSGIICVQAVIWAMAITITVLLDINYNKQMATLIDLRTGVYYFALANARLYSSTISGIELMFDEAGLLDASRYRQFIPTFNRQPAFETVYDFHRAVNYTERLFGLVYNSPWQYADRYLKFTGSYPLHLSPNQSTTLPLSFDLHTIYYLCFAAYRNWLPTMTRPDFNSSGLLDLYNALGTKGIAQIGTPILLNLIDTDNATYLDLTFQSRTIILASIVGSLILANAVILLILIIRSKIAYVYSAFSKLYEFEVNLEIDYLGNLKEALSHSLTDLFEFEKLFLAYLKRRSSSLVYSNEHRKRVKRSHIKKVFKMLFGDCYGLLTFVALSFALMEAFNLTVYGELQAITHQTDNKLQLMTNFRGVLSGSASLYSMIFRTYFLAIVRNNLGLQSINTTDLLSLIDVTPKTLEAQFLLIDAFVTDQVQKSTSVQVAGFDIFYTSPCAYYNKTYYNMSRQECVALPHAALSRSVIELYRWLRLTMPGIEKFIVNANGTQLLSLMNGPLFSELDFIRRGFLMPFLDRFCQDFFKKLKEYHQEVVNKIQGQLISYLVVSVVITLIINIVGYRYTSKQVYASLTSFLLLPHESSRNNPQIGVIMKQLS